MTSYQNTFIMEVYLEWVFVRGHCKRGKKRVVWIGHFLFNSQDGLVEVLVFAFFKLLLFSNALKLALQLSVVEKASFSIKLLIVVCVHTHTVRTNRPNGFTEWRVYVCMCLCHFCFASLLAKFFETV